MHNVIMLVKSVLNEKDNFYYYKMFSEKFSYKYHKNTYYEKTNISEGIDINTTGTYREYTIGIIK